jgi:hypothetical protein
MRFMSSRRPAERGLLALHDDGTLQVQPSDELRDEMARLEEVALERAHTYGTRLGVGLIALGALAAGLGWAAGRVFGRLGLSLSQPRPLDAVTLTRDGGGGVRLTLRGASRWQVVQMAWNGDEVLAPEADKFIETLEEMQRRP